VGTYCTDTLSAGKCDGGFKCKITWLFILIELPDSLQNFFLHYIVISQTARGVAYVWPSRIIKSNMHCSG
jgi:hypothetical protein